MPTRHCRADSTSANSSSRSERPRVDCTGFCRGHGPLLRRRGPRPRPDAFVAGMARSYMSEQQFERFGLQALPVSGLQPRDRRERSSGCRQPTHRDVRRRERTGRACGPKRGWHIVRESRAWPVPAKTSVAGMARSYTRNSQHSRIERFAVRGLVGAVTRDARPRSAKRGRYPITDPSPRATA